MFLERTISDRTLPYSFKYVKSFGAYASYTQIFSLKTI